MTTTASCERLALQLAEHARHARDTPEFRAHALRDVGSLIAHDTAVFSEFGCNDPLTVVGVDAHALEIIQYCERNFHLYSDEVEPLFSVARKVGGIVDSEIFSAEKRGKLSFYAEIMRGQGIRSVLMLLPRWRGRTMGNFRFERHGPPDFTLDDLAVALRVLPTVEIGLAALRADLVRRSDAMLALTQRETEVALQVARGLTTPQIARVLGTSKLTVRNQIARIFDKLKVTTRAELAACVACQSTESDDSRGNSDCSS